MEQALARSKALKGLKPTSSSAPVAEEESSEDSEDNDEQIENLQTEIATIKEKQEEYHRSSCEWQQKHTEDKNLLTARFDAYTFESNQRWNRLSEKMDSYYSKIMKYLHRYPPPPPPKSSVLSLESMFV